MATLRKPRVSLYTLGCKVNQYETRETAAELLRLGYQVVPFGQPVDACVVNTCSVTDQADVKSRGAAAYIALARELLARNQQENPHERTTASTR